MNNSSIPNFAARRTRRFVASMAVAVVAGLVATAAPAATTGTLLQARVATNRGCLEKGDSATFGVGEKIVIFLSARSTAFSQANATIFSIKPSSPTTAFLFGTIFTNVTYGFLSRVGPPTGIHELKLKVSAAGVTSFHSCSFNVVDTTPTRTPQTSATATRTATPTRTPTPTKTPSPMMSPSTGLNPHVRTSRGCQETGDDPVFYIGESVIVSYGVDSDTADLAQIVLFDILPGGFTNVLRNRIILTNNTFSFKAGVAPPTGVETLKLRASASGFTTRTTFCTFTVLPGPPPH